jgi:hypothetical protein
MNKQKKISPPSASRPILSRSTRMRDMQTNVSTINFFGTTISFVPSSVPTRRRYEYSEQELYDYIKSNGPDYCHKIMETDCGVAGPSDGDWNKRSPFAKWYKYVSSCPNFFEQRDNNCTTGCRGFLQCVDP